MKPVQQFLLLVLIILFSGCVTLYKPNAVYSPLLKEKGELNGAVSLSLTGSGLFNAQSSYAVSDHMGVLIDGMYHRRKSGSADSSMDKLDMFFGEAGAGYFTRFGDSKNKLFQCYTGGGGGSTTDKIPGNGLAVPELKAKYFNLFIQPGIATFNKNFNFAFDMRINYIQMYHIHAYLYNKFDWWNTDFHFYSDTSLNFVNLEPTFTMKAGGKKMKGTVQVGLTIPVINTHSFFMVNTSLTPAIPLLKFSIGMSYTIGKK